MCVMAEHADAGTHLLHAKLLELDAIRYEVTFASAASSRSCVGAAAHTAEFGHTLDIYVCETWMP